MKIRSAAAQVTPRKARVCRPLVILLSSASERQLLYAVNGSTDERLLLSAVGYLRSGLRRPVDLDCGVASAGDMEYFFPGGEADWQCRPTPHKRAALPRFQFRS